jgi:protein SCO1
MRSRPARSGQCFLCAILLALLLSAGAQAQQSFGVASSKPPNEDLYVYKAIPDIAIQTTDGASRTLSTIWRDTPILLTMVFTRCAGICSPFLHSLKSAAQDAQGMGRDYRVVVLSFDPQDKIGDMAMLAQEIGVKSDPNWIFGIASPVDIRRVAAASGFWFQWDAANQQYDHPSVVVAVDRGRVIRMLAGASVPDASLREVVQELGGQFVASYALAGKVAFRCFEYDPNSGRYSLDWGLLLMLLPGSGAIAATFWVFFLVPGGKAKAEDYE